jgi:3-phosphoshikimate 1-carboxyvinyltransferase
MKKEFVPVKRAGGVITVPGDKSIAHRAALLSILAESPLVAVNYPDNRDCNSSMEAARKFGVDVERDGGTVTFTPPSRMELPPDTIIDCGNSATTARLLAGLSAGSELTVILSGDDSLSTRPMKRIIDPLREMGAEVFDQDGHLPLKIQGKKLLPFEYRLPVASAQVKTALILAALASKCSLVLQEDNITRDHTEIMLSQFGEGLSVREIKPVMTPDPHDPRKKRMTMSEDFKKEIKLASHAAVKGGTVDIPGDISTAAFFMAAAAISSGTLTINNLGLNPTRTAFIEHLKYIGCKVEISEKSILSGEPRGNVTVSGGPLKARKISGETTVGLIDEIPIVAVMAAFAEGTTIIRDAAELKVKECDRLSAIANNLGKMGVRCGLLEDGLAIEGGGEHSGADFESFGDHRVAMAFSIAALFVDGPSSIDDDSSIAVSCPGFYNLLESIVQ